MRETPTHASQSSPADVPPAVWQALAERYEHRRFLGSGGMGVVYLAHDRVLDRDVALKFPQPAYVADDILRQRFQREARVTARLELEGVCPIYDSGVAAGFSYIAMRFIEGMGLDEWIRSHRLSERGVLSLIRRLALVMDDVHRRGIVHRDLKPGNILIDRNTQRPVIADFGCSKYLDQGTSGEDKHAAPLTSSNQLIGTVPYMPLEAFEGADITASTQWDIYSLGAIFYELITGERPLGNQFHEVVNRHVKGPPPVPVAQIRDDVDPRTSAICMKMLSQEPQDRHASMGEIATEIEGVLSSLKATATIPETTSELPQRRSTRRDATVGIIGVVLAALFVLIRGAEHLPDPDTSVKSVEQSLVSLPPSQQESIPELPVKYGASGAASAPLPSRRYFLGVAISQFSTDDYSGFPEAEQEMQDLSDALETRDFQTIALLSGSDAGRDMIISALGSLRERTQPRDTLVVALSSDHCLDPRGTGRVYAACYDSSAGSAEQVVGTTLGVDRIVDELGQLKGRRILLVADVAMGIGTQVDLEQIYRQRVAEIYPDVGPQLCLLSFVCPWHKREDSPPSAVRELTRWLNSQHQGSASSLLAAIGSDPDFWPGWLKFPDPSAPDVSRDFELILPVDPVERTP